MRRRNGYLDQRKFMKTLDDTYELDLTSAKVTHMTDLELAQQHSIAPWDDILTDTEQCVVFKDRYPVTLGHLLFVPKYNDIDGIQHCFKMAQRFGHSMVMSGSADGYNIGLNCHQAAGQTVMYPHVHLIPRIHGDCDDPVGGIRGVIPGQANYRSSGYQLP